jgi:hypothetical protein
MTTQFQILSPDHNFSISIARFTNSADSRHCQVTQSPSSSLLFLAITSFRWFYGHQELEAFAQSWRNNAEALNKYITMETWKFRVYQTLVWIKYQAPSSMNNSVWALTRFWIARRLSHVVLHYTALLFSGSKLMYSYPSSASLHFLVMFFAGRANLGRRVNRDEPCLSLGRPHQKRKLDEKCVTIIN